jgi:muramidase (phage lysozyme)
MIILFLKSPKAKRKYRISPVLISIHIFNRTYQLIERMNMTLSSLLPQGESGRLQNVQKKGRKLTTGKKKGYPGNQGARTKSDVSQHPKRDLESDVRAELKHQATRTRYPT